MIFDSSIKGLGYVPDDKVEDIDEDEYNELAEDIAMEWYYEEKYRDNN